MKDYIKKWAIGFVPISLICGLVGLAGVWTPLVLLAPPAVMGLIWLPYMIGDNELTYRRRKKGKR